MLRKLSGWLAQSKHGSSRSSLRSPAPQFQVHQDSDAVDVVDTWAALPIDLILEIFLRLEPAAVIRCAGVCKPWRRAIIGNASILGPHLDRFLGPSLLLGVFHYDRTAACLQRTPGPFQSALPSNGGGGGGNETPANSLIPAAAFAALPTLLSSKDGFILLRARSADSLCLCNPMTGYCTIVPAADAKHCKYILLTGSSSDDDDDPAVRILAVHRRGEISIMFLDAERLAYQLFSTSGDRAWVWGPVVQCSGDHLELGHRLYVRMDRRSTAVAQDAVYWLAGNGLEVTRAFALDVRTGRIWTTELQMQCHPSILGMSSDGRLFLVQSISGPCIKVWVLSGDAQWNLQRTISIDTCNLPLRSSDFSQSTYLSAFCPRSRCMVALWSDQKLLIDIDSSGSIPRIWRIGKRKGYHCHCCPYEMDSSTYISEMKHF